ncbi:MAG: 2-C-methyl-D-erythritol 4-phosphate cytidylyltransferase [Gammaproteobacteria bacterium]
MGNEPRFWAVIPAAGSGVRMGGAIPKQYLTLAGRTVIEHVLDCFLSHARIAGITVAVVSNDPYWQRYLLRSQGKPVCIAEGGEERAHSVLNALHSLREELKQDDWVLVHDAVRPCLHHDDIDHLIRTLAHDSVGGILATPLTDTVKRVDEDRVIRETIDRQQLWRAFTPQMFRYGLLTAALETALNSGHVPTDEAAAMEIAGYAVRVVPGRSDNLKITCGEDMGLAEAILKQRGDRHT